MEHRRAADGLVFDRQRHHYGRITEVVAADRPARPGPPVDQDDGKVQRHHRHQTDRLQLHEADRGGHRGRQAGADRECRRRSGRAARPDIAKAGVQTR